MVQKSSYDQWVVQELENGNLMIEEGVVYGKLKNTGQRNPIGYIASSGIMEMSLLISGKSIRYPVCRVIWINTNKEIPEGYIITHCDKNQLNNQLDNLQMEVYKDRKYNPLRWSEKDVEWLKQNRISMSLPQLAECLGRSIKSVRHKIKNIGMPLKRKKWREWTEEEDQKLTGCYKKHMSVNDIAAVLNRSINSVRLRANRILKAYRSDTHLQNVFRSKNFYTSLKQTICRGTSGAQCCLCDYFNHVDLHHIDGDNENHVISNIASLCPNHHREVENKEYLDEELYCVWWRVYSDGSLTDRIDNRKEVLQGKRRGK